MTLRTGVFPLSDQLPLVSRRRPVRAVSPDAHPTEHPKVRPFGVRFATVPADAVDLDLDAVGYDDDRQIATAWDGTARVPLTRHAMGITLRTTGEIPREDEIHDKS